MRLGPNDSAVLIHGAESTSEGQALARLVLRHYHGTLLMTSTNQKDNLFLQDDVDQCVWVDPALLLHDIKKTKQNVRKYRLLKRTHYIVVVVAVIVFIGLARPTCIDALSP